MQPHQQRVVNEKLELDDKAAKLKDFIFTSHIFAALPFVEQTRLQEQIYFMDGYSRILGERIAAF